MKYIIVGNCFPRRLAGAVLILLSVALACTLAAAPALSQPSCAPLKSVHTKLQDMHGEAPVTRGILSNGLLMVLYGAGTGSFTLVYVRGDGLACVMASGEDLEHVTPRVNLLPVVSPPWVPWGGADRCAGVLARPASFGS